MSIITRILSAIRAPQSETVQKDVGAPTSYAGGGFAMGWHPSSTGSPATAYTALQTPVYACCRVLSEDIARLPLRVRKRLSKGGSDEDRRHPVARLLGIRPNDWQTPFEFMSHLVWSLSLRGNAYAYIRRAGDGTPVGLIPLLPDMVSVMMNSQTGAIYYQATSPHFGIAHTMTISSEDMIHVKNISLDGIIGCSPVSVGGESISLNQAMQNHAGSVFKSGTMLRGVLSTDGELSPEAKANLASAWMQAYSGSGNAHRVALLEDNVKFSPISLSPEDAQLIEQRRFSIEEIARLFRVPLHKIGAATAADTGNVEVLESGYVNDSLMPLARRIEETLEMRLLFEDERDTISIKFDFDSTLRSDMKTRFDCYQIALLNGIYCINEVRSSEGLPPVSHGDEYRVPLNQAALTSDSAIGAAMTTPGIPKPDNNLIASDEKPTAPDDDEDAQ